MITVIDNFLTPEEFAIVQEESKQLEYEQIKIGNDPSYKLDSGIIFKTLRKHWSNKRLGSFDLFFDKLLTVDKRPSDEFSLMVHVYHPGAELAWHSDAYNWKGAYTFYIHDEWRSEWNGQLLISDPIHDHHGNNTNVFDHRQDVMDPGMGRYIEPKPNRLVLMTDKNYMHKVVRPLHMRKSFTGFFK